MGRPKKCRWVETKPGVTFFKPRGIPLRALEQTTITVDELEAIRLADYLELTQEEVAAFQSGVPDALAGPQDDAPFRRRGQARP